MLDDFNLQLQCEDYSDFMSWNDALEDPRYFYEESEDD